MLFKNVIFDLDGTLIDSAASILESIQVALHEAGIQPVQPMTPDLIGPPLDHVLKEIIGHEQEAHLPLIKKHFMHHYDNSGYMKTQAYDGVTILLDSLRRNSIDVYIATNKRITPTTRIIQHLGWRKFIEQIYALDSFSPPAPSKGVMLLKLCDNITNPAHSVYVGDREEDGVAAEEAGLNFIFAKWGYGNEGSSRRNWRDVRTPSELERYLVEQSTATHALKAPGYKQ